MADEPASESNSEETVPLEDVKARLAGKEPPSKQEVADPPKPKPPADPPPKDDDEPEQDIEDVLKQADKPDAVRNAIAMEKQRVQKMRERAEAAELRVKEYEDRDKTEEQKREEKAEGDRKRADAAEAKLQRVEIAIAAKLPLELAERLRGDTKEELETDAERLLDLVKPNTPTGDPDAGKGAAPSKEVDMNDLLRRQAKVA